MNLTKEMQGLVGQEYFKRKIFRKIAEWFKEWLKKYPPEQIKEKIAKNQFIIEDLEKELIKMYPKNTIIQYLPEIELYKSSITEQDKHTITKMVYFQLPEYRDELSKNHVWLNYQIMQLLIAFDSYIFKIKQEVSQKGGIK